MKFPAMVTTLAALALLAGPTQATVRRVPLDFATITAALAASAQGDTVLVAAGTYSPSTNGETFPLLMTTPGIQLLGAGMDTTVLDAESTASVIRHDVAGLSRISGFRITRGNGVQGGGVDIVNGDVQIDHNRIDQNGASVGGAGVWARNAAAPWIHHNLFLDNFATSTTDVHAVRFNQHVTGVFEHNLVAHSDGNGLITVDSAATSIRHNIFYLNGIPAPVRGRGICWLSDAPAVIFHNLFFQNQLAALLWLGGGGDFSGSAANNFSPTDQVFGNIDLDPLFVNASAGDYHLQAGSPAINAGYPALPLDPDGTIADIGPFATLYLVSVPPAPGERLSLSASPNPLRSGTEIRFSLPATAQVRVEVLDPSGRIVRLLDDGTREAGVHVVRWDGAGSGGLALRSGVYYVRLRAGEVVRALPVVVIR